MDELTSRAYAAYFRSEGAAADQPSNTSGPVEWQGMTYVVLANAARILAVYRVRTSGALKRLRRWPSQITP